MTRLHAPSRLRRFAAALSLIVSVAASAALVPGASAQPSNEVSTIVVRFNESMLDPAAAAMPAGLQWWLESQLGAGFRIEGRTRDGGFRIALSSALTVDEARAAVNRARMDGRVLYAAIAPPVGTTAIPDVIDPALSPPTDRLVVRFRGVAQQSAALAGIPPDQLQVDRLASVAGAALAFRRYMHDGAAVMQLMQRTPIADVERMAARIAAQPDVDFAQPDYIDQIQLTPNDTCYGIGGLSLSGCAFSYQWDLFDPTAGINAPAAWDITTGSANIRVAVLDTGALYGHPDLSSRFIAGYDMITSGVGSVDPRDGNSRDADASDAGDWTTANQCFSGSGASNSSWHGSHVAGTIGAAGNNATGIAGINWTSPILPVRVLGSCGGYSSDIADGITWASGGTVSGVPVNPTPARVLNLSLGGFRSGQTCDSVYATAITGALSRNAVVVVSAGNNNWDSSFNTPANCGGVITVAATGERGYKAYYSNWGTQVEIAAPGGDFRFNATTAPNQLGILSSLNNGTTVPASHIYTEYQGTSMAAPHVAGVASLMLSVNPSLTPAQLLAKMQIGARGFVNTPSVACTNLNSPGPGGSNNVSISQWLACNCSTTLCGAGFLDAFRAVAISQPSGAVTTTGLVSSANPAAAGASVTFTATVSGIVPTGSVTFRDGGANLCTNVALAGSGDQRTAACTTSALSPGNHPITAAFNGDGNNATSTSPVLNQSIGTLPPPPSGGLARAGARHDLNGDGRSDIFWSNAGTGEKAAWLMNGIGIAGGGGLLADANWSIVQMGDFNGDGRTDLVWRHAVTGENVMWLMNGVAYAGGGSLLTSASWTIARTGDLNGDGRTDLVWRNGATGEVVVWLMNGAAFAGGGALLADPAWNLTHVADFNGDGRDDLLWRNGATGETAMWLMNGAAFAGGGTVLADPAWTATHVRDFNGDGRADIVWRSTAGATAVWLMNGATFAGGAGLLNDPNWNVVAADDLDGNGRADILWRNTATGDTAAWMMNGGSIVGGGGLLTGTAWSIVGTADLNGDGRADILWNNGATGEKVAWLMNGLGIVAGGTLLTSNAWVVSP